MKRTRRWLGLALLAATVSVSAQPQPESNEAPAAPPEMQMPPGMMMPGQGGDIEDPTVVMRINGQDITRGQLNMAKQRLMMNPQSMMQGGAMPPADPSQLDHQMTIGAREAVIGSALFEPVVKEAAAAIPAEAVDKRIAEISALLANNGQTLEEFKTSNRLTDEILRQQLSFDLAARQVVEQATGPIEPTDEEIAAFFEENQEKLVKPERLKTSQIFIPFTEAQAEATDEEKAAAKTKAEEAKERIDKGEEFGAVADEVSVLTDFAGGALPEMAKGEMPPALEEKVWDQPIGDVSDVIESEYGYHIVKVTDRKDSEPATLEKSKEELRHFLTERNLEARIPLVKLQLREKAEIEYVDPELAPAPGELSAADGDSTDTLTDESAVTATEAEQ